MTTTTVRAIREAEPSVPLVERLIATGVISDYQLQLAIREQSKRDQPIGRILVELGLISEGVLKATLTDLLEHDELDLANAIPDADALGLIPKNVANRFKLLPISFDADEQLLTLAVTESFDAAAIDQVVAILDSGVGIRTRTVHDMTMRLALERFYAYELSIPGVLQEIDSSDIVTLNNAVDQESYNHPLVRLVDAIIADGVQCRASDVHFEPESGFVRVRYRIDGVLHQVLALHRDYWPGLINRLKGMFFDKIINKRKPQHSQVSRTLAGRHFNLQISYHETTHGENVVVRLRDRYKCPLPLEKLTANAQTLTSLQLMMARPQGMIIVAGPPGSGKTTTLYSILNYRNDESVNIMTLESPVEFPLAMIRQASVSKGDKIDFRGRIRSMMRQNPDVILVGELRDEETADLAFGAAMTGHQVFTTLRATSALGALQRLVDIGVQAPTVAGNIIGIVAQRLIRQLCPSCKRQYAPDGAERKLLGFGHSTTKQLYREGGCAKCDFLGYKGRIAIVEVLRIGEQLDDVISRGATRKELHKVALESGFEDIAKEAIRHVLDGTTSLSEVSRVVDLTARVQ